MSPAAIIIRHFEPEDTAVLRSLAAPDPAQARAIRAANGRLWTATLAGTAVAYAAVTPVPGLPGLLDLAGGVLPARRRQGIGTQLLGHVLADLRSPAPAAARQLTHAVPSLTTPAAHFLGRHGFVLEHEEWEMVLTGLAQLPPPIALPGSRLATLPRPQAIPLLLRLYTASFGHTPWYQPFSPGEVAATLTASHHLLFLFLDNEPVGFAWLRPDTPDTAVIEPIGIARAWQGRGYGRFLLLAALHRLAAAGSQSVALGVWSTNSVALRLYQQLGFARQATTYYLARGIVE